VHANLRTIREFFANFATQILAFYKQKQAGPRKMETLAPEATVHEGFNSFKRVLSDQI
jgi:hypothetical protein